MLILLSPAKNLDFKPAPAALPRTEPQFIAQTEKLLAAAKKLSPAALKRLMGISDALAQLNWRRFQEFDAEDAKDEVKQAALAFNGDVYQALQAKTLDTDDIEWAQGRLRILSGLYGLLRPLDAIRPYRLEMGVKFSPTRGKDLYDFWRPLIAPSLNADLAADPHPWILNLASEEYAGAVDRKAIAAPIISPAFQEVKDGKARSIFMFAKRARGLMARYAIEKRVTRPEQLKAFAVGGYRFDAAASDAERWVFARPQPPPVTARKPAGRA